MEKVKIYVVPIWQLGKSTRNHMFLILIMLLDIELPFKSWIGTSHNVNGYILINCVGRSEINSKLQKKYSRWEMRNQISIAKVCLQKMRGMVPCVCVYKIVQKVTGTKTDLSGLRFWSVCKCLSKVRQPWALLSEAATLQRGRKFAHNSKSGQNLKEGNISIFLKRSNWL